MIGYRKNQSRLCSFWLALPVLAAIGFSASLWSADTAEPEKPTQQSLPENDQQGNQAAEESETADDFKADDFKPSEEISEDFPVPLPSDI